MKKFFTLAWVAMFALASQAQIVSSRSTHVETVPEVKEPSRNWSYLYLQYNSVASGFKMEDEKEALEGLSLGYNINYRLTDAIPLFLETGIGLQIVGKSKIDASPLASSLSSYYGSKDVSFVMPSVKIPLGASYVFDIPNTPISIIPNAGFDLRIIGAAVMDGDILAEISGHKDWDFCDKDQLEQRIKDVYNRAIGMSSLSGSAKEMWKKQAEEDAKAFADEYLFKRVQFGCHLGVSARFWKKLLLGMQYQFDFTETAKDLTMNQFNATLAVCF